MELITIHSKISPLLQILGFFCLASLAPAATYEVGPGQALANVGDVPWEALQAGDTVRIHWRAQPYKEKWVLCRQGTAQNWITVQGVPNAQGALPIIDGNGATTRRQLNFWGEERGVIKIGGANTPADTMPSYIKIENLDIRGGRPPYSFTGRNGPTDYAANCAAVFVEKGQHVTVRNCDLHDCGNGMFAAAQSGNVLVDGCFIYDNGIEGDIYEHNNYTEANGITFQYNHFGPLRAGCLGNNLKDRSAGLVVRYNWIEAGNRQLDLVDSDHAELLASPAYRSTFVYGNILVEPDGAGNRQIIHYGGDSGNTNNYRKGTLYFYNNTVVSTRTDRTSLFRLSTDGELCDCRNNIIYVSAAGSTLALLEDAGTADLRNNWIKAGWIRSFGGGGTVNDHGGMVTGAAPGFANTMAQDFHLAGTSTCIDKGTALAPAALPAQAVTMQYLKHQKSEARRTQGPPDVGAFEAVGWGVGKSFADYQ